MIILSIDTSCDETSVAVMDGLTPLSNVISSQIRFHKKFGGVVPFLAQRLHKERIESVVQLALSRAGVSPQQLGAVAVTYGPGLAPALEVGIEYAYQFALQYQLPLLGVNHMWGHFASCLIGLAKPIEYPCLGVLVSGGHSEIVVASQFGQAQIVGQTLDDALGEAFDKAAIMLGLSYPGGKLVAKLAKAGDPTSYPLPIPMLKSGDFNLSYSGLKNATRLVIERTKQSGLNPIEIANICASFQSSANQSLILKLEKVLASTPETKAVLLGGGVAANLDLRQRLRKACAPYGLKPIFPANLKLCTDNAAMIGAAASLSLEAGYAPPQGKRPDRVPYLTIEDGPVFCA